MTDKIISGDIDKEIEAGMKNGVHAKEGDDRPAHVMAEDEKKEAEEAEYKKIFTVPDMGRGRYLIEVRFGRQRKRDHTVARIDLFKNTFLSFGENLEQTFGSEKMFLCGYADCGAPIEQKFVGSYIAPSKLKMIVDNNPRSWGKMLRSAWSICPTCEKAKRNNGGRQINSVEFQGYRVKQAVKQHGAAEAESRLLSASNNTHLTDRLTGKKYAVLRDTVFIAAPVQKIAEVVERFWHQLGGNADVVTKYHRYTLQEQIDMGYYDHEQPLYDTNDEIAIFPLSSIVAQTTAGSSLVNRLVAFFTS